MEQRVLVSLYLQSIVREKMVNRERAPPDGHYDYPFPVRVESALSNCRYLLWKYQHHLRKEYERDLHRDLYQSCRVTAGSFPKKD